VNVRDQTKFTVTDPDGGMFTLSIQNPIDRTIWVSGQISTKAASTWEVTVAIQGYWNSVWGARIDLLREMFDATGKATNIVNNA